MSINVISWFPSFNPKGLMKLKKILHILSLTTFIFCFNHLFSTPVDKFPHIDGGTNYTSYISTVSGLIVLDPTKNIIDTIACPQIATKGELSDLVITSNGRFAYAIDKKNVEIQVINLDNQTLLTTIKIVEASDLKGIALNALGTRIYVGAKTGPSSGGIVVIDTTINQVIGYKFAGEAPLNLVINSEGSRAIIISNSQVEQYDIVNDAPKLLSIMSIDQEPFDMAIHPITSEVYVTFPKASSIGIFDFNFASMKIISGVSFPFGIAITPDGATAYVVSRPHSLINNLIPIDLTTSVPIPGSPFSAGINFGYPEYVAVTPNGKNAYITQTGFFGITYIDLSLKAIVYFQPFTTVPNKVAIDQIPKAKSTYTSAPTDQIIPPIPKKHARLYCPHKIKIRQKIKKHNKKRYIVNTITWLPPSKGQTPIAYQLYRDRSLKNLIVEINASQLLCYRDYISSSRRKRIVYYLVAVGEEGKLSKVVKVRPNRFYLPQN